MENNQIPENPAAELSTQAADRNVMLIRFATAAINGSAATLLSRHDFSAGKVAKHAMEIAKAMMDEIHNG